MVLLPGWWGFELRCVRKRNLRVTLYARTAGRPKALLKIIRGNQSARSAVNRAGNELYPAAAAGSLAAAGSVDVHPGLHGGIKHGCALWYAYAYINRLKVDGNSLHV
jgi:hypothetical protein